MKLSYAKLKKELEYERQRAKRACYLAYYDSVTGMPNRNYFQGTLAKLLIEQKQRTGVLMIDLHGFSLVNDMLGHQAGYQLLREVEERLIETAPDTCIIANIWGDKFLLAVPGITDVSQLAKLAGHILTSCGKPLRMEDHQLSLTVNVGIAVSPEDGAEAIVLMKKADMAVARSKAQGKNGYAFYKPNFVTHALNSLKLETKLRNALDNNEFYLEYQPRIQLSTGGIRSFEALIRWRDPELGIVGPGAFIPLAEMTGLIEDIGKWVLVTACRQAKAWRDKGFEPGVSVNLSARQFYQPDLVDSILFILAETKLEPECLELEITESMIMRDVEQAIITLQELKASGIRISMDDFGTGHSSLTNLKRLPVDVLKIDKSFIQDVESSDESGTIIQVIIALGHVLKLTVTAEGVETWEQLSNVRKAGCDEVQGYYFSRPVSPEAAFQMLAEENIPLRHFKNQLAMDSSCL